MLSDFVQLTPDRNASITRDAGDPQLLHLTVSGHSYEQLKSADGPSRVEVSVEERRPGLDASLAEELAWTPVGTPVVLQAQTRIAGATFWQGNVNLPAGAGPFRIVIKEFELYPVLGFFAFTQRRLVYADAIEV